LPDVGIFGVEGTEEAGGFTVDPEGGTGASTGFSARGATAGGGVAVTPEAKIFSAVSTISSTLLEAVLTVIP